MSESEVICITAYGKFFTGVTPYDLSTLYTTLPHNLINEKRIDLIERAFKKFYRNEGTLYLACIARKAFFTSTDHR